jgi:glyoxylate reductase
MARVVVTRRLPAGGGTDLPSDAVVWDGPGPMPRAALLEAVADAEGLLTMLTDRVDQALLDAAPGLRVISQMAVGVDNVDLAACARRDIAVGHTPDVLTETTADTAFALLAAAVRRIPEGIDVVREGRWGPWDPEFLLGGDLHRTTLGIVGLGRIGAAIARRGTGFGMSLRYTSRHRKPDLEARLGIAYRPFDELLAESDHVVLATPLDDATRHLIDADSIRLMKPTATLVNIGRGPLVDHDALADALADGRIAAAALDVTEPEPIPADHPLVTEPRCLIVPHIGSASVRTRRAMADLAVSNLLAGLAGEPLPTQV